MRAGMLMLMLFLFAYVGGCRHAVTTSSTVALRGPATTFLASTAKKPDFEREIKPIFHTRCQPCHFPGGKVYEKMPFDKPETITRLGEKLFTRIKDKNEQRLIREFLSQP
jgi:hypothetical protein